MIYLKRVIAVIENSRYLDEMRQLGETLKAKELKAEGPEAEGLEYLCLRTTEMERPECLYLGPEEMERPECLYPEPEQLQSVGDAATAACPKQVGQVPTLWLTDCERWVEALCRAGQPVLALLHEENSGQNLSGARYACQEPWQVDADYLDRVFRRYRGLPWDILQTPRCFVRETVPEDAEAFYRIYSEASITRYTEGLFPEIQQEKRYIREYIEKVYGFYNFGVWTILEKDSGDIIGRAGFSLREGFEEPELGYVIGLPWQGRGYAEEVCRAILDYGWEELGFEGVHAFVRPENEASLALCRKLGMEPSGEVCVEGKMHLCMQIKAPGMEK